VTTLVQALRGITLVEALLLIGWAVAVIQEASKFRPANLYVRTIAASYIVLVLLAGFQSWLIVGDSRHVLELLVVRVLGLTYGLWAMFLMWRHYRYPARLARHARDSEAAAARLRESAGIPPESKP
jgi:hypothetical protein